MLLTEDKPRPLAPARGIPNGVLGMILFVMTEIMFFAGLISAFMIVKSNAVGGWPPPGQPRLPAGETAINTAALLASAVALYVANRDFRLGSDRSAKFLVAAIGLGGFFVIFQGVEWFSLLAEGLTLTSSPHGSFFYLIVGTHAVHAIAALGVLMMTWLKLRSDSLSPYAFWPAQIFWYFVVGMWPIIYWRVYW